MSAVPEVPATSTAQALSVVCLCAEWCGTCREYQATFAELQAALPAHTYRYIDIEDEADLVGDVDVETFPTLMVTHQGKVLFAGPVLPRLGDAQRLLETLHAALADAQATGRTLVPQVDAEQAEAYDELATRLA